MASFRFINGRAQCRAILLKHADFLPCVAMLLCSLIDRIKKSPLLVSPPGIRIVSYSNSDLSSESSVTFQAFNLFRAHTYIPKWIPGRRLAHQLVAEILPQRIEHGVG